jgi:hypothetical protein
MWKYLHQAMYGITGKYRRAGGRPYTSLEKFVKTAAAAFLPLSHFHEASKCVRKQK